MGVTSQRIDLLQPEQVGPMSLPKGGVTGQKCTARSTTLLTEKNAAFQACNSEYGQARFGIGPGKALTRRLWIDVHTAGWLHSIVPHGCNRHVGVTVILRLHWISKTEPQQA